ncbi:MAG: protein kinase, partial [Myxococcales bacterium]|nr:protein kinase [Myxococcales bacterium]
ARGVIHRDFKPDNVLVVDGPTGPRAKLLDFGFARVEEDDDPDLTQVHRDTFGTPDYMAPEQANGDGPIGPPTDLYAVGAVLYELLSGQPPFTGPTAMAVVFKQIMEAVPPLGPRAGLTLPPALPEVVGRALAKAPRARFQTANDMRRALAALQGKPSARLEAVPAAPPSDEESTLVGVPVGVPAQSSAVAGLPTQDITGRDAEMDWLWQHVHRACAQGAGRVVLLGGAPGLGRSALTDWLAGLVAEGGWMHVVRGAPGVDAELGHGALRAGLAQLFGGLPPGVESAREAIAETVTRWQAARGPVPAARAQAERAALVALADYVLPEPGTPQALQGDLLFSRVGQALALAAAERPVLWLLDGAEALGPVMARFVAWLAHALAASPWPLLVVVSHPVDPVGRPLAEGAVAPLVEALSVLGSVARRVLTPLPHGVLAQLLVDEHGLSGELAHVLARASAGNLRFALVLAEVLQQRATLVPGPGGLTLGPGADPTRWPTTLEEADVAWVVERLEALPDTALAEQTLCAAAVLGHAVDYGLLVDCVARAGTEVARVEQAIEALLQAGLMDEVRDWRLDRLHFAHPGRRQACL